MTCLIIPVPFPAANRKELYSQSPWNSGIPQYEDHGTGLQEPAGHSRTQTLLKNIRPFEGINQADKPEFFQEMR